MQIDDIIKILMQRDNISHAEAKNLVACCRADLHALAANGGSYDDAEDCLADWLGLEPDYMEILLM